MIQKRLVEKRKEVGERRCHHKLTEGEGFHTKWVWVKFS